MLFEEAETLIKEQKRDLFATTELVIPGAANTNLNKVVEKCSRILQFGSESDYVDDALLIIGKSFYYQKNYLKGIRKFQELLATQTESDLLLETELWIGKSQMKLREENKGLETLRSVRKKAIDEGEYEILKETYIEEIVYFIANENNPAALTLLNEFLETSDDDEINAEIVYQAGKLYLIENDTPNAILSFEKVFDYSPSYDIEQDAYIQLGMALREGGELEKSLEIFEYMRDEDKYSIAFDIIDLERGITLYELDRVDEAIDQLNIVDSTYTNSTSSGIARYVIGNIYESTLSNYDSALVYYTKAAGSAISDEYKPLAQEKSKLFRKYAGLRTAIDLNAKKLFYLKNPEVYTQDSLTYVQDSLAYIADSLMNVDVSHLFEMPKDFFGADTSLVDSTKIDSLAADSLKKLMALDSLKNNTTVGNRTRERGGDEKISTTTGETTSTIEKPKLNKPVRPDIPEDSIKTLLAKDQLELGNLFLGELRRADSAYYYYDNILTNLPGTQYQAGTLYALGTYYLTKEEKEKADSLFNEIYENYKSESIVNAAANQLNKPLIVLDFDPAKDLYAAAESKMNDSSYNESLKQFQHIYKTYPGSEYAPKALYATGWILENNLLKPDSAAVIYDTILVKYPSSVYAGAIRPKLNFYKQEKERIKRAVEDSLRLIQQQIADSIKADSLKQITPVKTEEEIQDSLNNLNPNLIEPTGEEVIDPESDEGKKEEEGGEDGGEKISFYRNSEFVPPKYFVHSVAGKYFLKNSDKHLPVS